MPSVSMQALCVMFRCQVFRVLRVLGVAVALASSTLAFADALSDGQNALIQGDEGGAIRLWTPPATGGNPEAQFRLGMMYLQGRGVAADRTMAMRWFKLAIEQHHIGASIAMAHFLLDKANPHYDPDRALALLRDVGQQGVTEAQADLGQLYRKGGGVSQDFDEARHWYQLAAAKGDIASQAGLGELYRYGYGVAQSYPRAYMWFSLAASALTENRPDRIAAAHAAIKARDELERMMSPEERTEAERLALACWQAKLQNCD